MNKGGRSAAGTGGRYISVYDAGPPNSLQISIGKELWREIGSPRRVFVVRNGGLVAISATTEADDTPGAYRVSGGVANAPKFRVGRNIAEDEYSLAAGRYERCEIKNGTIMVQV